MKRHGRPEVIVTDRLRSYGAALKDLGRGGDREMDRWLNNRAENSHLPFRRRERAMSQFRRMRTLLKFASTHASVHNHFPTEHHIQRRKTYKLTRAAGLSIHTQHRVRQNTATRILADFAQTATAPPGDRKIDFAGVLDRQEMPTRAALRRLRAPATEPQPSSSALTVTRGLARKRENPTIPLRRPPAGRRRQMRVRATIPASSRPPFLPDSHLRYRPAPSLPKSSPAALPSKKDNRIMQHSTRRAHRENQT